MPTFDVTASIVIAAEPSAVQQHIRNFRTWNTWSPWVVAEPECTMTYDDDGKGYGWDGNIIGAGRMRIDAERDGNIDYTLTFLRPFKSSNKTSFRFAPTAGGTQVTWHMQGSLPFFVFFLKRSIAAMVGADFRRGLAKLKDVVEIGAAPSQMAFAGVGDGVSTAYVGVRGQASIAELGSALSTHFATLQQWCTTSGTAPAGPALALYHAFDVVNQRADFTAAIPVAAPPADLPAQLHAGSLAAPRTYKIEHTGAYRHLPNAWAVGMMHGRAKRYAPNKRVASFERYVDAPGTGEEASRRTEVHFPAK